MHFVGTQRKGWLPLLPIIIVIGSYPRAAKEECFSGLVRLKKALASALDK